MAAVFTKSGVFCWPCPPAASANRAVLSVAVAALDVYHLLENGS